MTKQNIISRSPLTLYFELPTAQIIFSKGGSGTEVLVIEIIIALRRGNTYTIPIRERKLFSLMSIGTLTTIDL